MARSNASELDAPDSQLVGVRHPRDIEYWNDLSGILASFPHSKEDLLHHWPIYVRRTNMVRFLAHHEIFRSVAEMPGSIVEIGVSRGMSFFSWVKFLELYCPTDTSKRVFGFDNFQGLDNFHEKDGRLSSADDKVTGGWAASGALKDEFYRLVKLVNSDGILSKNRAIVYEGELTETLAKWKSEFPGAKIKLLHIDVDLFEPTAIALRELWDAVHPGGVIVFDEYGLPPWKGETLAWDEFQAERGIALAPRKIHGSFTPSAYFVKPSSR